MIPPLNHLGFLPPGVHPATLDELIERFGTGTLQRLAMADSLRWLLPLARRAQITKVLINGSFVTDRPEPNDVDCVLLIPAGYNEHDSAVIELLNGLPFLEIKLVPATEYEWFASVLFATTRGRTPKGLVELTP